MEKLNDKKLITNRLLGLCGVALLGCWVLKLWGKVVFDFVVTNEVMISVCNFIENSVVQYIIFWMFYILSIMLIMLSISGKKKFPLKHNLIFIGIFTGIFFLNFLNPLVKMIVDIIATILISIIVYKVKWWKSALIMLGVQLTQLVLLQIRNLGYTLYFDNFLVGLLIQLDYYIMLVILYIRRTS